MYTTSMPNFKEIHQYLVPQSCENFQKLRIPKFSISFFWKFWTTDKDENGIVELAMKS